MFGFKNILPVTVLCLFSFFKNTDLVPISDNDIFDFGEYWDYKIKPHNLPLLKSAEHYFLSAVYEYDEDLLVSSLNEKEEITDQNRLPKKIHDVIRNKIPCGICKLGIGMLRGHLDNGDSMEEIRTKVISLCVSLKIESETVCAGFFDVFGPELIPSFNRSTLDSSQTCMMVFGESCPTVANKQHEWSVDIPNNKLRVEDTQPRRPSVEIPVLKVLHLSDTHLDLDYVAGSPANCDEPLCCRNFSTPSSTEPLVPAGRWGSYNKCDSPKILIENMLNHIALEHPDVDYIIWTGDLPPHDIWNQTKQDNLDTIKECVEQMLQFFPTTPIFPAVGNHESVPAGSFAPPWMKNDAHSINWLYTALAEHWRTWLPASAGNTLLHGAFYSVLLRPGFRLISLNTNYCHSLSWWLVVNSTDPAQELQWLIYELDNAEKNNEKVHIIGHISPGSSDCLKEWSRNFYSIVDRYKNVIRALFYGHSHADEFELFYDTDNYTKPINVAYLGPSMTTYENHNPAYRIYYVEGDFDQSRRDVIDHETWTTNLEKANEGDNEPVWYKSYSARDEYSMQSLDPEEWNKLVNKMATNDDTFDLFYRHYYRHSSTRPTCDTECKVQILCDLKTGRSQDRKHICGDLQYV